MQTSDCLRLNASAGAGFSQILIIADASSTRLFRKVNMRERGYKREKIYKNPLFPFTGAAFNRRRPTVCDLSAINDFHAGGATW